MIFPSLTVYLATSLVSWLLINSTTTIIIVMWTAYIYIELINWVPFILSTTLEIRYMTIRHHLITKSCLTLSNSLDCSPPGSSVHGITQARILEWVIISFSRGSPQLRDRTCVFCVAGGFFNHRATWEALCDYWLGINAIHQVFLAFSLQNTWTALRLIGRIRRLYLAIEYEQGRRVLFTGQSTIAGSRSLSFFLPPIITQQHLGW